MANEFADQSTVIIYADGIKPNSSPEQLKRIEETRRVIKEKQWCKEVNIRVLEENLGVDQSTIRHVTEVINTYNKAIVLEDDCVTSKGFLRFINEALEIYENQEKVMNISGYMFPVKEKLPSTVMLKGYTCNWGWGTWKRAWSHYDPDYQSLATQISASPKLIKEFNIEYSYDYLKMLQDCSEAHKPWDICWYASVFLNDGYCIWPGNSLVQNIGHDASGVHCGITDNYTIDSLTDYAPVTKLPLITNELARNAIVEFHNSLYYNNRYEKLIWKLKTFIPYQIKRQLKSITATYAKKSTMDS
jgi:hypothetical protein